MKQEDYQKSYKLNEALKKGAQILKETGFDSYILDSKVLMQFILNYSQEELILNHDSYITLMQAEKYFTLIERRSNSEPVAYIVQNKEFWGYNFKVTPDTLIPRPDSETLISAVLLELPDQKKEMDILDLGIGSGCLAISLLHEYPASFVVGVDLYLPTLLVAKENAISHGVHNRMLLVNSSWASAINKNFDLIIANPPYVKLNYKSQMQTDVLDFEPHLALFGGDDGLNCYRQISNYVSKTLKAGGLFICECGIDQDEKIVEIFQKVGLNIKAKYNDLSGRVRCVSFTNIFSNGF